MERSCKGFSIDPRGVLCEAHIVGIPANERDLSTAGKTHLGGLFDAVSKKLVLDAASDNAPAGQNFQPVWNAIRDQVFGVYPAP
ncbi:hypothetical protein KEM48_008700 [Puccinia striiformis f. sp. tritici PST-130]|nr:hypothetical protein KEM48_008700 [Puccinia striiformis f. sp. tritici PST-130]